MAANPSGRKKNERYGFDGRRSYGKLARSWLALVAKGLPSELSDSMGLHAVNKESSFGATKEEFGAEFMVVVVGGCEQYDDGVDGKAGFKGISGNDENHEDRDVA
mmetsp:Transcript_22822/g.64605  ORF Transcript_22822/g.64605 Transcript_22822/m.64605 type:complete len:105 (+) Transcript_22822:771-1085(+)